MGAFEGNVALITGAGKGLGRELACGFVALGARVAANDINPINLDETVSQLRQAGGEAQGFVFDVAKRMPIEGLVAQVLERFGRIDILVNQAVVDPRANLLEIDEWDFHRTLDVNLGGPFFCMQQVGRSMQKLGGGVMVNMVSFPRAENEKTGHTALIASQAGLVALTRAAAQELSPHHIRVNAVLRSPGDRDVVFTVGWDPAVFQQWQQALASIPSGELSATTRLVLFLCSPVAASITGQVIPVDW
jgi:NAD(P)-dependent dehydrogenase (short-subunit alcohol dehydrogenase family)